LSRSQSLDQIAAEVKQAYQDYSRLKKQASALRDTFLERLALEQASDRQLDPTTHLKTLCKREWQHKVYRQIRTIHQPDRQYGRLTMVLTPDGCECHTKDSIEMACLSENQASFNQVKDTLLLQPLLYGLLGLLGTGSAAPSILAGKFQFPDNPIIQETMNALHHCDPINSLGPVCITSVDY